MHIPIITECIAASSTIGNNVILAKNRDRPYKPEIQIVRKLVNGVEVALFHDMTTGWAEGINEFGIGLINTALLVGQDEKEKQIVQKSGKKSADGPRITTALGHKTLKEVVKVAVTMNGGVKGHTFIANKKAGFIIEATSKHKYDIKDLNMEAVTVRTNHGHIYPNAGYTEGIKYLSSRIRKITAEKQLSDVEDYHIIARTMRQPFYQENSMLNMARDTEEMFTSSQIVLNLNSLEMMVYLFKNKIEKFHGVKNELPEGYTPKIKIKAFMVNR
jgi:hypothetical protein